MPTPNDHERAAAGMDYDSPFRERASRLGSTLAANGPAALFDEIENLVPESWREHISAYPITAVLVALGLGVYLGMRKSDEIIAAGTSMITSMAMSNLTAAMGRAGGGDE
jgi:hypothetical protein